MLGAHRGEVLGAGHAGRGGPAGRVGDVGVVAVGADVAGREHEPVEPVGPPDRRLHEREPAEAEPEGVDAVEAQVVEQPDEVGGEVGQRGLAVDVGRPPVALLLDRHHPPSGAQRREHRGEAQLDRQVTAGHQQQRDPAAPVLLVVERDPVEVRVRHRQVPARSST